MNSPDALAQPSSQLDAQMAVQLLGRASDLAMVMDGNGVIRDVQLSVNDLPLADTKKWIGKSWSDTVTSESRPKVTDILRDAAKNEPGRWRHINYPSPVGADVPFLCSALALGSNGEIIAFGRDLRNMAALQQRLVEAHQAMERDYMRMRHMETRYRLLFELASEAILIVDTPGHRILEANPAAGKILGTQSKRLIGKTFSEGFTPKIQQQIQELLSGVRASGDPATISVPGPKEGVHIQVTASLFRQESGNLFLVRLSPATVAGSNAAQSHERSALFAVLENSPDAFVVTDVSGRIITANQSFVDMTQLTKAEQVLGEPLDRWLGRSGVDLSVLIANLQQRGSVRLFATTLRGDTGGETQVEISGVSVASGPIPCLGFSIRDIGSRMGGERPSLKQLPRSADQLVELVGRVPLQEIVSETADLIEKLCIEAALTLTRDNRASASEMLGLSRQSLYVKLRRYGIGDLAERAKK